jgi:AraC family transcriptional regulator
MPLASDNHPLGRCLRSERIGSFVFVQHEYAQRAERGRHAHEWTHFSIVQRGRYSRTLRARAHDYRAGSVAPLWAGETHTDSYSPGCQCLHLAAPASLEKSLRADFNCTSANADEISIAVSAASAVALHREFRHPDTRSAMVVEALVIDLVSRGVALSIERSAFRPPWLGTVLEYLDDTFEEQWTLDDIAREVGIHPVYLCRAFSQHLRCTLGEYIRSLRTLRGWQLLSLDPATIAEVATAAGFADESHFSRSFKKRFGITPGQHRRSTSHSTREPRLHG